MKQLTAITIFLLLFFLSWPAMAQSDHAVTGDIIKVVTPNNRARICPYPLCGTGEHLARIKTGTKLKVIDFINKGYAYVYEVNYKGKVGYISQYDVEVLR